jgi:hypothetical protein
MPGPTLGDTFRIYVKPSLDGLLVARKKTTRQTSSRVEASKERLRKLKNTANVPSKLAHEELVKLGKCPIKRVYKPGKGYEEKPVCPIKEMRSALRVQMKKVHGGA